MILMEMRNGFFLASFPQSLSFLFPLDLVRWVGFLAAMEWAEPPGSSPDSFGNCNFSSWPD